MKTKAKRLFCLILALGLLLCASACGKAPGASEEKPSAPASEGKTGNTEQAPSGQTEAGGGETQPAGGAPDDGREGDSRVLVLYFSRTGEQYTVGVIDKGNTAIVAGMIAERTGADMFEVKPADDHYPMTYNELTDVAKREQNDGARPAFAGTLPELSRYDTVFIGAPVWWGDWPMIMYTVFESADFSGKTLIPFSTHEGSGLSGFDRKLASACPGAEVLGGLAVRGNDAQNRQDSVRESVAGWLSGLGF